VSAPSQIATYEVGRIERGAVLSSTAAAQCVAYVLRRRSEVQDAWLTVDMLKSGMSSAGIAVRGK
jgi:hypothetical protein